MGYVRKLKEEVYKKIAAGEVVERPLSVMKELVENSIDAGASDIKVKVYDGGKSRIEVIDNGVGFEEEDVELAFKRHTTSKISELSDFDKLKTLGFRGEALPSILEVSRIELFTSNNDKGEGLYFKFESKDEVEKKRVAFDKGTHIIVKDLFYNYPVRKKFLKSSRTELNQIIDFIEKIALVNYDKNFELISDSKKVLFYEKVDCLKDRIYQIFGSEILDNLMEVENKVNSYEIHGFISKLNTGISSKKHQYFFVNNRYVREKTLIASFNNTFKNYLEKSKNPVGFLLLDVPSDSVDVNIHPMKLEIKFKDSSFIYGFIKKTIDMAFADQGYNNGIENDHTVNEEFSNENRMINKRELDYPLGMPGKLFEQKDNEKDEVKILGQYNYSYIIVEKDEKLLIVDQHNAHERINYDRLISQYRNNGVVKISPLFPIIIEMSHSELKVLNQKKFDFLNRLGFEIEVIGENSINIKTFPDILKEKDVKDTVISLLNMSMEGDDIEREFFSEIACKSAIKVNHRLSFFEMERIVRKLFETRNPYFCPHRRPIIIEYTLENIEKMMKRK